MSLNEDRLYSIIGERLKRIRIREGIPQSTLAAAIDHLRTSISNIEGGRQRPPLHVLYELCHQLGIELLTILPFDNEVRDEVLVSVRTGETTEHLPPQVAAAVQEILRVGSEASLD